MALLKDHNALQHLNLSGTAVSDLGLQHIEHLPKLKSLMLNDTQVTDAWLERMREKRPDLKIIAVRTRNH